jgi:hypothetical protein
MKLPRRGSGEERWTVSLVVEVKHSDKMGEPASFSFSFFEANERGGASFEDMVTSHFNP